MIRTAQSAIDLSVAQGINLPGQRRGKRIDDPVRGLTPVIKWAGGKRQLVTRLVELAPERFNGYLEPFVGGGALFFELYRQQRLSADVHLSDANLRLITLYQVIQREPELLISQLEQLGAQIYREDYEQARLEFNRRPPPESLRSAALFLYLNRLCFNGLYRVNRKGEFNVPFGRNPNPDVVRAEHLRLASNAFRRVFLWHEDFEAAMSRALPGDLVYLDPPYMPISATSSFTAYAGEFGWREQVRLAEACQSLDARGVYFMLSNSSHPQLIDLYSSFHCTRVKARRAINSVAEKRGEIEEIIIRNFRRSDEHDG